jgi:hypothetical protein
MPDYSEIPRKPITNALKYYPNQMFRNFQMDMLKCAAELYAKEG